MKLKFSTSLCLTAMAFTMAILPTSTAFANGYSDYSIVSGSMSEHPAPRYRYIIEAGIGIHPSASGTSYNLKIKGDSNVTSTSGTITLYKQSSSGSYTKIDSESIEESGSSFNKYGSLASNGSGKYKIEFVGRVYASDGSEPITINSYNSY